MFDAPLFNQAEKVDSARSFKTSFHETGRHCEGDVFLTKDNDYRIGVKDNDCTISYQLSVRPNTY